MPRLKLTGMDKAGRLLGAKVAYYRRYYGVTIEELAEAMHVCKETYYGRIRHPERMTLNQFFGLIKKLHFTEADLVEMLREAMEIQKGGE